MKTKKELEFELYLRGTDSSRYVEKIPLSRLIALIKNGEKVFPDDKFSLKEKIIKLRKTKKVDEERYKTAKQNILAPFSPSGYFETGRNLESLSGVTGIISIDIDHDLTPELLEKIKKDKHTYFMFTSPGNEGVKVFFTAKYKDPESYKKVFRSVQRYFIDNYGIKIDKQCSDITRLCFLSHDPDLYFNKKPQTYKPIPEREKPTKEKGRESTPFSDTFGEDFFKKLVYDTHKGATYQGDGRSRKLLLFGFDCHAFGISQDDALEVAHQLNNDFFEPPETDNIVKHQIECAYRYSRIPFGQFRAAFDSEETDKSKRKVLEALKKRMAVRDKLSDFIYVSSAERLINVKTGLDLTTATQINNYIAHHCATAMSITNILSLGLVDVAEKMDFSPTHPKLFKDSNAYTVFNRFNKLLILEEVTKKIQDKRNVTLFLDHLKYITTSEYEYTTLLHYIAFIVQHPGKKVDFAPLIITKNHGVGKSMLIDLFENLFQTGNGQEYVHAVTNSELADKNTGYMEDKLILFINELDQGEKWSIMTKLREMITDKTVNIINKYARTYKVRNTVNFFFFSNLPDAIRIDKNDRRLFVIFSDVDPQDVSYYEELGYVFEHGYRDIASYLMHLDISSFNPRKRPEITEGKRQLIAQSESELTIFLNERVLTKQVPFDQDILIVKEILDYVDNFGSGIIRNRAGQKAVKNYLIQEGYKHFEINKQLKSKQHFHVRLWAKKKPTDDEIEKFAHSREKNKSSEDALADF